MEKAAETILTILRSKLAGVARTYYHRTTFLQLNTIRFILTFPHPFIPSELSGSRRNESVSMSAFLFKDILPIIHCNSMQKVLDWPFCNLWQCAEPPNSKSDGTLLKTIWVKPKQKHILHAYGAENKNSCGGNEFYSSLVKDHRVLTTLLCSLSGLIYNILNV